MKPNSYKSVVNSYSRWKSKRVGQSHAPMRIKNMVVSLLPKHPITKICSDLGISYSTVKKWADSFPATKYSGTKAVAKLSKKSSKPDFLEVTNVIPLSSPTEEVKFEFRKPSGEKLIISGQLSPAMAESLARAFLQGQSPDLLLK
jgi:hypothetical protein